MVVSVRTFAVDPDTLFDVIADPATYPEWLTGAKRIESIDASFPHENADFDHVVGAGPVEVHDTTSVTDVQPGRSLSLIARARPLLEADVRFEVLPVPGGASRLRLTEEPRNASAVTRPLLERFIHWRNERSLQNLSRYLRERGLSS